MRNKQVEFNPYNTLSKLSRLGYEISVFEYTSEQPPEQPAYTSRLSLVGKMDVKLFLMFIVAENTGFGLYVTKFGLDVVTISYSRLSWFVCRTYWIPHFCQIRGDITKSFRCDHALKQLVHGFSSFHFDMAPRLRLGTISRGTWKPWTNKILWHINLSQLCILLDLFDINAILLYMLWHVIKNLQRCHLYCYHTNDKKITIPALSATSLRYRNKIEQHIYQDQLWVWWDYDIKPNCVTYKPRPTVSTMSLR